MRMTPVYNATLLSLIAQLDTTTKSELRGKYKEGYPGQLNNELEILRTCHAISIDGENIKYVGSPQPI